MKSSIKYTIKKARLKEIGEHLSACSSLFTPPLDSYVKISEYARKIFQKAHTIEAWSNQKLVGLIAIYINAENIGFITNVSVIKGFQGRGIGKKLFEQSIKICQKNFLNRIELEVKTENKSAISFYRQLGFKKSAKISNKTLKMYFLINQRNEI